MNRLAFPLLPLLLVAVVLTAGCGEASDPVPLPPDAAPVPVLAPVPSPDATWRVLDDAVRVWREGAEAWRPPKPDEAPAVAREVGDASEEEIEEFVEEDDAILESDPSPFTGLDGATADFLRNPWLHSAVQFSCAVMSHPSEHRVTEALGQGPPARRLLALTVLVKVHAPRSVAEQWQTLEALRDLSGHDALPTLLASLEDAFSADAVGRMLRRAPPEDRYADDYALEWACRAAGVRLHADLLPRLEALSRCGHLDVSLAAERSLEDFPGLEGDEALASCLLGWRYDAYVRAARALMDRNPGLLEETLLSARPPAKCVYQQAVFLGRLGNPSAVPLLCQELPGHKIIDREMFDLVERLARPEDVALVEALGGTVRSGQRARAEEVLANVRSRLHLEK